jgi:phosphatidylserine decarboxylase
VNYPPDRFAISREAWPFLAPAVVAALIAYGLGMRWWTLVPLVAAAYVLWFFRNPERMTPRRPDAVVAPADGRVVAAGVVPSEDFEDGQALRVAIFMSLFSVHVNWAPVGAKVTAAEHFPGKFLNAMDDKSGEENERKVMRLETPGGTRAVLKLVAGLVARRIVCPLEAGDSVAHGEKVGLIRFGSRAEVLLPASSRLQVSAGMSVRGGETILALLELSQPPADTPRTPAQTEQE